MARVPRQPNAVVCYTSTGKYLDWAKDALSTFLLHNPDFAGWLVVASRPFSYLQVPSASFRVMAKGFQRLTTLDADSITIGRYDRLLWDADILACHNAPGIFEPCTHRHLVAGGKEYNVDIDDDQHLNNHLCTVTSPEALADIVALCDANPLRIDSDQAYFNVVAHSGRYGLRWLDTEGVVYNEVGRDDLLAGKINLTTAPGARGNVLVTSTDQRRVCGIHWAGGEGNPDKRNLEVLPPLVAEAAAYSLAASAGISYNIVDYDHL